MPHFTQAFDAAGVKPGHLESLADIARFPFTVKTDLRDNYPFAMFAVPQGEVLRLHGSSGTTGRPTVVGYTKDDLTMWADLMARSLTCAGVRPGDVVHNACPPYRIPPGKKAQAKKRGWDDDSIDDTLGNAAETRKSKNMATENPATAYYDKKGNYIVRDDVTGDLIQFSDKTKLGWIPDPRIINPCTP